MQNGSAGGNGKRNAQSVSFKPRRLMETLWNLCKSQIGYPPCRKTWHADYYECLGIRNFPLKITNIVEVNP
jgi:hypothetical protein